jgi:DHA2 family multidrug resistance protein
MSQASSAPVSPVADKAMEGGALWIAALALAAANFVAVLNLTLANVAVPHIAGSLGAAASQSTWVITAYAVGEALTVPLTGWLASRFGAVRVFSTALALFGLVSLACGLSPSLPTLVAARILQGLCGGPLMPLSQTLLMRIFPKEKVGSAIGVWSMTTLVAPVLGPILGGWLCDNYSWHWVFVLNAPFAVLFALFAWNLLKRYTEPLSRNGIDKVGLVLLVVWVGALQILLDKGKDLDWFSSGIVVALTVVAVVGFAAFVIWELNDENPIVDLRVFRHRGYSVALLTLCLTYAAYFAVNVLTPQWLQTYMGYTATQSGMATAGTGLASFLMAPLVTTLSDRMDKRALVFFGVTWMGLMTLWRSVATTDMAFGNIALPLVAMGVALPFFFMPTTRVAMASVDTAEMASAAGLMSFVRTLSGAFSASVVTTAWSDQITRNHAELVGLADSDHSVQTLLAHNGMSPDAMLQALDGLVSGQSVMLATNQLMTCIGIMFLLAGGFIWLAPKPANVVMPADSGH